MAANAKKKPAEFVLVPFFPVFGSLNFCNQQYAAVLLRFLQPAAQRRVLAREKQAEKNG